MADKQYRSVALKRKLKNERQRREKEALSKLKTITGFFTPVTPQPDVPVLAERSVDNNLLEPIWFHVQSSPSVDYHLFSQKPWRRQQKQRLHQIGLQLLLILTLLILLAGVKFMRMCVLTGRGKVRSSVKIRRLMSKPLNATTNIRRDCFPKLISNESIWMVSPWPENGCCTHLPQAVFCLACCLFREGDGQFPLQSGYNDWKHAKADALPSMRIVTVIGRQCLITSTEQQLMGL